MTATATSWSRISGDTNSRLVLTLDFDVTRRQEATFRELVRLLPPGLEVWQALPPPARHQASKDARHYLDWWLQDSAHFGRPVHGVLSYCAGSVFAAALADLIEPCQGTRPVVVHFNPSLPSVPALRRDFRSLVDSVTVLSESERHVAHLRTEVACRELGKAFDAVSDRLLAIYTEVCGTAFERLGIDSDVGAELTALFGSYLSYLSAARQLKRDRRWAFAVSLYSRDHAGGGFTDQEITFDVSRTELLSNPEVAKAAYQLLAESS